MDVPKIFESEYRFCTILWEHEPIKSSALAALCGEKLGWKPTTAYTVMKRLAERGVIENRDTIVRSLVKREEAEQAEIDELGEKNRRISDEEAAELQKLIDGMRGR